MCNISFNIVYTQDDHQLLCAILLEDLCVIEVSYIYFLCLLLMFTFYIYKKLNKRVVPKKI